MGSTNSTPNYELSQFIGTDKPAWLQDYNGDMLKIDTGIAGAKTAADNAQSAADGAQGDATSALSNIADINTELGTVENTLSIATGNINTINSLIGNGEPTTTDKTLIGAINELNAGKKLVITDQSVTSTETTVADAMADLYTKLNAVADGLTSGRHIILKNVSIAGTRAAYVESAYQRFTKNGIIFATVNEVANDICITGNIALFSDSTNNFAKFCNITAAAVTFSDVMSTVISGTSAIAYSIVEVI